MTTENTRELALDMLVSINEEGQYSHLLLRQVLEKYQYLDKKERAFLTRLTEGTIERRITLDYVIDSFSRTKVNKMKPLIRNLLRLGVYQIMYMDSVPDSAACNEAVKLARKHGFSGLSGFVNGVLRSVARGWKEVTYPDERTASAKAWSVRYSVPEWMIALWQASYGMEQTREILEGFQGEFPLCIRVNKNKTTPEDLRKKLEAAGITVEAAGGLSHAFFVRGVDYPAAVPGFAEGEFYVQDISSMRVAELADVKKGDYVIDVCAAPGGKSIYLAELLKGSGMVEARDLTEYKVGMLEENIKRHGLTNCKAVLMDALADDADSHGRADVLICDLPCSGLGVMGKKTDIRYKMTLEKAKELAGLQRQILSVVHNYVKPGGTLVYSTCTLHDEENEKNVEWFAKNFPEFGLVSQEQIFNRAGQGDGYFLCKFVRDGAGR